ncbi:MAG: riboflavin synthase [Nitrospira sp.]|nr:riboflavin synthase [Nitrospira sp.]
MFTGIIEELGVVKQIDRQKLVRVTILAKTVLEAMKIGDSITVNGACLTVVSFNTSEMMVEISPETLEVTSLGSLKVGDGVNLERAMRLNDRLGGHLVTGHVDGMGRIRERRPEGDSSVLRIETPVEVLRYCIKKGSITVDGVSLTINDLTDKDFVVTVIPYTSKVTTLGLKGIGDTVNLEVDLIGKYVERFLRQGGPPPAMERIDIEYLRKHNLL